MVSPVNGWGTGLRRLHLGRRHRKHRGNEALVTKQVQWHSGEQQTRLEGLHSEPARRLEGELGSSHRAQESADGEPSPPKRGQAGASYLLVKPPGSLLRIGQPNQGGYRTLIPGSRRAWAPAGVEQNRTIRSGTYTRLLDQRVLVGGESETITTSCQGASVEPCRTRSSRPG